MKKVIVGIGMPASGKTAVLKELAREYGYDYICPDDLRLEIYGQIQYTVEPNDDSWKERSKEIWEKAKEKTKESLEMGNTVVFEAVFNNPEKRKEFFDFARQNGAEKIQGIYIDADVEVAKRRNKERERMVPEPIVDKIVEDFKENKPKVENGLDSIFTIDEYQNLVAAEIKKEEGNLKKEFR